MNGTLALEAKGPVTPVPVLKGHSQSVSAAIQTWPGIVAATHWHFSGSNEVDGADFYVGAEELGHIHLEGDVHLATTLELRKALMARKLARPFRYLASWVEASIDTPEDAAHAKWLFRLNYDRIMGEPVPSLLDRIAAYKGIEHP